MRTKPYSPTLNRSSPLARGLLAYLPFAEKSGLSTDNLAQEFYATISGCVWASGVDGAALRHDTTPSDNVKVFPNSSVFLPTNDVSVMTRFRKTDATNRGSGLFGLAGSDSTSSVTKRCGAHAPWSDGNVYFDFGGVNGNNRLTVGGLSFQTMSTCIFIAGSVGMQLWQDGVLVGSKSTPITRTDDASAFQIGTHANTGNDLIDVSAFGVWGRPLAETDVRSLTADPFGLVRPKRSLVSMFVEPATGNRRRRLLLMAS